MRGSGPRPPFGQSVPPSAPPMSALLPSAVLPGLVLSGVAGAAASFSADGELPGPPPSCWYVMLLMVVPPHPATNASAGATIENHSLARIAAQYARRDPGCNASEVWACAILFARRQCHRRMAPGGTGSSIE